MYEVFTFGNGDFITSIIQAVANYTNSHDFSTLLALTATLAMFVATIRAALVSAAGRNGAKTWLIAFGTVLLIYQALIVPKKTVIIHDEIFGTDQRIDNVPFGLAFLAHITTSIEKSLARGFDTFFSLPDELKYTYSGYGSGLLGLDATLTMPIMNPYLKTNWTGYIADCVIPAIAHGDIDESLILNSDDILGSGILDTHMLPSYFTTWYVDPHNPTSRQNLWCGDAYVKNQADITNYINGDLPTYYTNYLLGMSGFSAEGSTALSPIVLSFLGAAGNYFLDAANDGMKILSQAVAMNLISSASEDILSAYSPDPNAALLARAIAMLGYRNSASTSAQLAKVFVPVFRRVIEGLIYGVFPIVIAMVFIPGFTQSLFKSYLILFLWLVWWSPIFSILNLILNTRAHGIFYAVQQAGCHFCMNQLPLIANGLTDAIGVAGNMLWLVPMFSFALASGSMYAFVSGIERMGGYVASLGQSAGAQTAATPEGISSAASAGRNLVEASHAQRLGMSWKEIQEQTAMMNPKIYDAYWSHWHGGRGWEGVMKREFQGLSKDFNIASPDLAGQKQAADINAATDTWRARMQGIAGKANLTQQELSALEAIDQVVGREFKGDISRISSKTAATTAQNIRQHAFTQAEKYAQTDSGILSRALDAIRSLEHTQVWNEKKGTSEDWRKAESITHALKSYYDETRKLGIDEKTATDLLLKNWAKGEAGPSIFLAKAKAGIEGNKSWQDTKVRTIAAEKAARLANSLGKSLRDEHALDTFRRLSQSVNDIDAQKSLSTIHRALHSVYSHSKEIGEEFRQADALERISRDEEALKQVLGTDPRDLFEKNLVEKYGIEGAKKLLNRAQWDKNTRMQVMDDYRAFLSNLMQENAGRLKISPPSTSATIQKPKDIKDEITEGIAYIQGQVQYFEPIPPKGYGNLQPKVKESLGQLKAQREYWNHIKKAKEDYIMQYGATQFYLKTGIRPSTWENWEKGMNDYFNSSAILNIEKGANKLLDWGDKTLGKLGKLLGKAGILYLEGAKHFPNEDVPHSEVGVGLYHLSGIQVEKGPVNVPQNQAAAPTQTPTSGKITPGQTIDLKGITPANKRPRASKK